MIQREFATTVTKQRFDEVTDAGRMPNTLTGVGLHFVLLLSVEGGGIGSWLRSNEKSVDCVPWKSNPERPEKTESPIQRVVKRGLRIDERLHTSGDLLPK